MRAAWCVSDGLLRRQAVLYDFGFFDDDGLYGHVVMVAVAFGGDFFDGVHHLEAVGDFAEDGVASVLDDPSAVHFFGSLVGVDVVGGVE